ncbi:MAG: hypothetical protein U0232_09430 [Thermomicrobiales bacterium]
MLGAPAPELLDQSRLPDPRFATDQHKLRPPALGVPPERHQVGTLLALPTSSGPTARSA